MLILTTVLVTFLPSSADVKEPTPEQRALAFLIQEVPRWSKENKCYSCHNNGDAARALYQALRLSHPVPAKALEDTNRWLAKPDGWEKNGGDDAPKDIGLARVQFAAALMEAIDVGQLKDKQALTRAAELVAEQQKKDGAWRPDGEETIGSPVTYGAVLITSQARQVLHRADAKRYQDAIAKADRWLRQAPIKNTLDAAAIVLALEGSDDTEAQKQVRQGLELIRKGQAKDGGWGPYVDSAPEPFDTALVLLALAKRKKEKDLQPLLERGRGYLLSTQQKDGSWIETTRPAGSESYAQRISTTGWAVLALFATRGE